MTDYYIENENRELKEYGIEFFPQLNYKTEQVVSPHIHSALEFLYIISGNFKITIDNSKTTTAQAGDMLFFRANTLHSVSRCDGNEKPLYYVLKISTDLVFTTFVGREQIKYTIPFLQKKSDDTVCIKEKELSVEIKKLWQDMISEFNKHSNMFYFTERANASMLLIMLINSGLVNYSEATEINRKTIELVYLATDYINNNFSSDITPYSCADFLHISYGYFAKIFKTVIGKTFKEYLCSVRLSKAHTLLASGEMSSVTEAASVCGYSNVSYFIAEYKKAFGTTPGNAKSQK